MKIDPYQKVDGISLEVQESEFLLNFGTLQHKQVSNTELTEFTFGSKVFRFDSIGNLIEVTVESAVVELNRICIPFKNLAAYVKGGDPASFDKYGFIVSPAFGIAFDPEYSPWVTVLTRKGLTAWGGNLRI